MAYSAFQSNAFQNNAFQIVRSNSPVLRGALGNYRADNYALPYDRHYEEYRRNELEKRHAELRLVDEELSGAESLRDLKLSKASADASGRRKEKNAAKKLAALEASLQDEINVLRMERVRLMRLIDDEEAILVLLLSWPLH